MMMLMFPMRCANDVSFVIIICILNIFYMYVNSILLSHVII